MAEWIEGIISVISQNVVLNYLCRLSLSISVTILFLLMLRPLMKKLPRIGMYILWILVMFRIVCPFSLGGIYELLPSEVGRSAAQIRQHVELNEIAYRLAAAQRDETYGGEKNGYHLKSESGEEKVSEDTAENAQPENKSSDVAKAIEPEKKEIVCDTTQVVWEQWLTAENIIFSIWITGVFLCLFYLFQSLKKNRRLLKDAVHLYDNVYEQPYVCSSFVGGIISPKIYVPEGMEQEELEYILFHERVHIRRWDYRIKPAAFMICSLLWFNPLVWVAYRCMITDMEISCDETVIRSLGSNARKKYSYLILAMASGENGMLQSAPGFGAGVVSERIYNIMKYKKPTKVMTAVVVAAVVLCGCGISSAPGGDTVQDITKEKPDTDTVYVEQTVPEMNLEWEGYYAGMQDYVINPDGNLESLVVLYRRADSGKAPDFKEEFYGKVELVDGEWRKEEVNWEKSCKELLKGRDVELMRNYYAPDGSLYLVFYEYSMNSEKYFSNQDKYGEDAWYLVGQTLLKVNTDTGEAVEFDVPTESMEEAFGEKEKGIAYNSYFFFADGNYLVCDYGNIFAMYDGNTGEKLYDVPGLKNAGRTSVPICTGDDIIVWGEANQETNQIEIHICDEDGKNPYVIGTEVKYEKDKLADIALGVEENMIIMANSQGIFEMEYGDDEFKNIANSQKDNLYYLSPDNYKAYDKILKGKKGEYYIGLTNEDSDNSVYCSYTPKE